MEIGSSVAQNLHARERLRLTRSGPSAKIEFEPEQWRSTTASTATITHAAIIAHRDNPRPYGPSLGRNATHTRFISIPPPETNCTRENESRTPSLLSTGGYGVACEAFLGGWLSYIHHGVRVVHAALVRAVRRPLLLREGVREVCTNVWASETQCHRIRGLGVDRANPANAPNLFRGDGAVLRRDGHGGAAKGQRAITC